MKYFASLCALIALIAVSLSIWFYFDRWASCSLLEVITSQKKIHCFYFDSVESWGQLGDFFGGVLNPVFGLLTVALLIITLIINHKAMEQTLLEVKQQTKAQERAQLIQNFTSVLEIAREEISEIRQSGRSIKGLSRNYVAKILQNNIQGSDSLLLSLSRYRVTMTRSVYSIMEFISFESEIDKRKQLMSLCLAYVPYELFIAVLGVANFENDKFTEHSIDELSNFVYSLLNIVPIKDISETCRIEIDRINNKMFY